jgi:hypothetical protein
MTDSRAHLKSLLAAAAEAARFYKGRDKSEPGRRRKEDYERRLADAVQAYQRRTAKRIKEADAGQLQLPGMIARDDKFMADVETIISQAAQDGIVLFQVSAPIGINVATGAAVAQAWAQAYARDLAKGIMGTTTAQLAGALQQFASTPGVTVGDVAARLFSPEVNLSRSYTIATTEITRAYSEANQIAGRQLAREYPDLKMVKRWATNNDDRVCPLCGPLNQKEIPLSEPYQAGGKEFAGPPLHPNCRCWLMVYPGE